MILLRDILIEKSDSKIRSIRPSSVFIESLEDDSYYCCFKKWSGIQQELVQGPIRLVQVFKDIEFTSFKKRGLNDYIFIRKFMENYHENPYHYKKSNFKFSIIDENRNTVQCGILNGVIFTSLSFDNYNFQNNENPVENTFTINARFDTFTFGQRN